MSNERNIEVFSVALDEALEAAQENAEEVFRSAAFDLFSKIIQRTPVDTGRARANWQLALRSPNLKKVGRARKRKATNRKLLSDRRKLEIIALDRLYKDWKPGYSVWITNNLPYINRLETGTWSDQAPQGMVAISIAEVQQAITLRRDL